jgi:hypothetical protein
MPEHQRGQTTLAQQPCRSANKVPVRGRLLWCETVQPAVRKATGKRAIYGLGQPMSTVGNDTRNSFFQFLFAHDAYFVGPDGDLLFDRPGVRERIVAALEDYTRPAMHGCNPPGAVTWGDADNNLCYLIWQDRSGLTWGRHLCIEGYRNG